MGNLRGVRNAVGVARAVLEHTTHTLLVGDGAQEFAEMMGFASEGTETQNSDALYKEWREQKCQPNYYKYSCDPLLRDHAHPFWRVPYV